MTELAGRMSVQRSYQTDTADTTTYCYATVNGKVTLAELIEHFGADADIQLNLGTIIWSEEATADEVERRKQQRAATAERHSTWKRETYERLKAEFEGS